MFKFARTLSFEILESDTASTISLALGLLSLSPLLTVGLVVGDLGANLFSPLELAIALGFELA